MQNPLWGKRKSETECCFIRCNNQVKHSILIRSDRKCFYTKVYYNEWWQQKPGKQTNLQNNINRTFLILIELFQNQTNKLNSENWLEV